MEKVRRNVGDIVITNPCPARNGASTARKKLEGSTLPFKIISVVNSPWDEFDGNYIAAAAYLDGTPVFIPGGLWSSETILFEPSMYSIFN
jgi:hypothetical protein